MITVELPTLLEQAWSRALPGREAASQNEVLRAAHTLDPVQVAALFGRDVGPRRETYTAVGKWP